MTTWATFKDAVPPDVDVGYSARQARTGIHIPIPLHYQGRLIGIISLHCLQSVPIDPNLVRLLCVIGAHAAPSIANANARRLLEFRQKYLQNVLNAIPDEVAIIDQGCRLLEMNAAKKSNHPNAFLGGLCYHQFEVGKCGTCYGCFTLQAMRDKPISRALWRYTNPETKKKNYVEISAGKVEMEDLHPPQAVEVVECCGRREVLLDWLQQILKKLPDPDPNRRDWLWQHLPDGAKKIGFPRCRVYEFSQNHFDGKICKPKKSFHDKTLKRFKDFHIDVETDLPSRIIVEEAKMRPVRFFVKPDIEKPWEVERSGAEWNYISCNVKKVPKISAERLGKKNIKCWAEIPLGLGSQLIGKMSLDKGENADDSFSFITDYEMALLTLFGKFVSIAMHVIRQKESLLQAASEESDIITNVAQHIGHTLNHQLDLSKFQDIIETAPKRLNGLAQDCLTFLHSVDRMRRRFYYLARMDSDRFTSDGPWSASKLYESLKKPLQEGCNSKDLLFDQPRLKDFGNKIKCNRDTLVDDVLGLMTNSYKYAAGGGGNRRDIRIRIRLAVRLANKRDIARSALLHKQRGKNRYAVVEFRDNGVGIPNDKKEYIFTKRTATERMRSKKGNSFGLGLPLARKLARALDGDMVECGEFGKGARFLIFLPTNP